MEFAQPYLQRIEKLLIEILPSSETEPKRLHAAMRYSVLNGGKRLRPLLVYATGEALSVPLAELDYAACAVELIHAYSLIHDDLPAMDDDNLRRGRPTCHIAFDEATAILAGDALQTLAFELLATPNFIDKNDNNLYQKQLLMVQTLANASGSRGMAGGQALDLAAANSTIDVNYLKNMHALKTGALINASIKLATLLAEDINEELKNNLDNYGVCIGLAFQIQDDILDVEGETEITGKQRGKDQDHNKPNYPSIVGLAEAKAQVCGLYEQAVKSLVIFNQKANYLREIAGYIISRNH